MDIDVEDPRRTPGREGHVRLGPLAPPAAEHCLVRACVLEPAGCERPLSGTWEHRSPTAGVVQGRIAVHLDSSRWTRLSLATSSTSVAASSAARPSAPASLSSWRGYGARRPTSIAPTVTAFRSASRASLA